MPAPQGGRRRGGRRGGERLGSRARAVACHQPSFRQPGRSAPPVTDKGWEDAWAARCALCAARRPPEQLRPSLVSDHGAPLRARSSSVRGPRAWVFHPSGARRAVSPEAQAADALAWWVRTRAQGLRLRWCWDPPRRRLPGRSPARPPALSQSASPSGGSPVRGRCRHHLRVRAGRRRSDSAELMAVL